ncbi:MAG: Lrp/AsnC family transcriptional regulator [Nanoarchaeota archaeon]
MSQIDEENSVIEKVDARDLKILDILKENARTTYQQIAKRVLLSHDAVAERVKRLHISGIISKFTLDVNYRLLDYDEYYLFLQLLENDDEELGKFFTYLKDSQYFSQVIHYSGNRDLCIAIKTHNLNETDEVITDVNNHFAKIILGQELMRKVKNLSKENTVPRKKEIDLDAKDIQLLNLLLEDSRMNAVDLASKLSLSPDAVVYRIKKLVTSGIIRKFTITLNVNKLGNRWYTILLLMNLLTANEEKKLQEYARSNKNVVRIFKTIGEWNVILDFLVKNSNELHSCIKEIKNMLRGSLKDYDISLGYKELKNSFKIIL